MKAEITLENKAKFFAQYMFQRVLMWHDQSILYAVDGSDLAVVSTRKNVYFLLLKPLSSITDDDLIAVGGIVYLSGNRKLKDSTLRGLGVSIIDVYEQSGVD